MLSGIVIKIPVYLLGYFDYPVKLHRTDVQHRSAGGARFFSSEYFTKEQNRKVEAASVLAPDTIFLKHICQQLFCASTLKDA